MNFNNKGVILSYLLITRRIYKHDKNTKEQNMLPEKRLQYHQEKSGPLMEKLYDWLTSQIEQNLKQGPVH